MYSPQVLDHFQNPRNAGEVAAGVRARTENPVCGDILELTARIEGGVICELRFRAKGCVPAMACGSFITSLMVGKTPAEAAKINPKMIVNSIGGLPEASGHAAHLAVDCLRALLRQIGSEI
jgi:nitrogen fixation NifU-like protein